jgi:hemolysin-activating ACP:hemolysin acyltransferase
MEMPIGRLHWLMNEIRMLRQSRLYFSDDGAPAGVLTWAWLSERTIARLAHVPLHDVHASEWNEGDHLCFVDVAASAGVRPAIERDVMAALFPEESAALVYYPPRPDMPATVVHVDRQREPGKVRQWIGAACSTSASRSG